MNAAVTNNNNTCVAAPLARRVSGGAARRVAALTRGAPCRATSMPGAPTTKLKDLGTIEAQHDAEMLKPSSSPTRWPRSSPDRPSPDAPGL